MVAVKVLAGPLANDPAFRASIRREAMASARLIHPHVTQVFDFGEQSAGSGVVLPYLVMELVEGDNLHDRLREGALPWPQAVEVGADVAEALEAAHRIGVVHLDIKPDNVMLTRAGAKVLDFGIAALAGRQPFAGNGLRVGTPTYSAPERRHGAGKFSPKHDHECVLSFASVKLRLVAAAKIADIRLRPAIELRAPSCRWRGEGASLRVFRQ